MLARRTRLAFLNAQAALEALPTVIDMMSQELNWSKERQEREWVETVSFLESMGLPAKKRGVSRKDVESGRVAKWESEEEYRLYERHGELQLSLSP